MASIAFGERDDDIKPVVPEGASDSAALDAVFELLVRAGRSAPMAKTMLIPASWSKDAFMPEEHRAMYAYCNSVMEPWDGPAAIVGYDGRYVIAGMDRNGLRPLRYCRTEDGLVIVGSEAGMVPVEEERIIEKGRVGPGQMIAVDLVDGGFLHDGALKDRLARSHPFAEWVRHFRDERVLEEKAPADEPVTIADADERRRRAVLAGIDFENLELVIRPQAEGGKEAIGAMGDDSPLAVLAPGYRPLAHFFRQRFSQVTNPPIDPLREARVMSLKTRFANFANVLDADNPQDKVLTIDSPVLTNRGYAALKSYLDAESAVIDCTFPVAEGEGALRAALERIRAEAEEAVRAGRGQLFLTDEATGADRLPVPMILAVGGVHTHLLQRGLRTFASINVRVADCIDPHGLAVLIGVGATTVNPYLVQDLLAERFGPARVKRRDGGWEDAAWLRRWKKALEDGLLKIMSKMGISVVSSYRGGMNFEALGLSRALVAEFFPGMPSKISGIGLATIEERLKAQHGIAYGAAKA
ncbi:MAG: glutamate synthase large subunit, partial [Alphaproteobacteria bacterium]